MFYRVFFTFRDLGKKGEKFKWSSKTRTFYPAK